MPHDADLRAVFATTFGCEPPPGNFTPHDLEEWDSLGHVKLVLQLESDLGIRVEPAEILTLHRDYDTVARYVTANRTETSPCA
jgi:acyl carrier protein